MSVRDTSVKNSLENFNVNPNAPLRLLSLDGGGVRGLSSLMVLEKLMESISKEEKRIGRRPMSDNSDLKPCEYFDLIGGTSTGGIIAVLLGRLRLDCRTCIEIYSNLSKAIFKKDESINFMGLKIPISAHRFSGAVLEREIKNALKKLGYKEDESMWDDTTFYEGPDPSDKDSIWQGVEDTSEPTGPKRVDSARSQGKSSGMSSRPKGSMSTVGQGNEGGRTSRSTNKPNQPGEQKPDNFWKMQGRPVEMQKSAPPGCRCFVVTTLQNALGLPRIISTYEPKDRAISIWQALRATSAAPTFFEPISFGTPKITYIDGGIGWNNPCSEVIYAAKSIWAGRPVGCIVSIGTGLQTLPSVKKPTPWLPQGLGTDIALASALVLMATSTSRVHNEMQRTYYDTDTAYFRFDVDGGLSGVSLEQWMREDEISSLTEEYMGHPQVVRRSRQLSELITKFSALPRMFEIAASQFSVGLDGNDVMDGYYEYEEVEVKTHISSPPTSPGPIASFGQRESMMGIWGNDSGSADEHEVYQTVTPVWSLSSGGAMERGRLEKGIVVTCLGSENVCLRMLRRNVPHGLFRVKFLLSFFDPKEGAKRITVEPALSEVNQAVQDDRLEIPSEILLSVGKPYDPQVFMNSFVDVRITPDIVPALLQPDSVRLRIGHERFSRLKGKGWQEIEGDGPVKVGTDGCIGFVISRRFEEGTYVGGWSVGGIKMEPVLGS